MFSTPTGEAMAHTLATLPQFERRLISQRTKEALAVKKARASGLAGRRLCRKRWCVGFSVSVPVATLSGDRGLT